MSSVRILLSASTDPHFNLAVEDTIFRLMPATQKVLFLWRNDQTVVIGKGQNPWRECNTRQMETDGITLARRQTGGGAVFHDLGNTNFTFMAGKPDYDKSISTNIVLSALRTLQIEAQASGRNDLVIQTDDGEKKFSGSAYRETKDRGFHHGTLLLSADLARLADYLNPDPKKLQAKGVESVRSRVINLREIYQDIDHEVVCQAIMAAFLDFYAEDRSSQGAVSQEVAPEWIDPTHMPTLPGFQAVFDLQKSWDWNYGRTLDFSHVLTERFTWGGVEVQLDVRDAIIADARIFTDSLFPDALEQVARRLVGRRYTAAVVSSAVRSTPTEQRPLAAELQQLGAWLGEQVK